MSHYLAVGCISAREVFSRSTACPNFAGVAHRLMWREWHRFNAISWGRRLFWLQGPARVERPWRSDENMVKAWRDGRTGIPYIDACMRELKQTGWLAYKGRKTAAHFLVFGLGVDWRIGAFIFEEFLLDYDCAMNYGNWVTVAEVDKHRRFDLQEASTVDALVEMTKENVAWKLAAERANDPSGSYIRKWVPELQGVPDAKVHTPWAMGEEEMAKCGCIVGEDYAASLVGPVELPDEDVADASKQAPRQKGLRRVHPADSSGKAYTRREFIGHARALGEADAVGQRLWDEAVCAATLAQEVALLKEQLAAREAELAVRDRELGVKSARIESAADEELREPKKPRNA